MLHYQRDLTLENLAVTQNDRIRAIHSGMSPATAYPPDQGLGQEQERQKVEQERQRAERLAEKLRTLGVDPDSI